MGDLKSWFVMVSVIAALVVPQMVGAQCSTFVENTVAPDREYMGLKPNGQRIWVGQEFMTDCDGQFLTVSFLVDVQLVPAEGITNLTAGDVLTCTLMDDQNQPIASVDQVLAGFVGLEWVVFDFGFEALGLAAGTLAAKVSTPQDAYCLVAKSVDQMPGRMMQGNETELNYVDDRDLGFRATWDPEADIVGVQENSWGSVKALFR
jgi:hypothetical protein